MVRPTAFLHLARHSLSCLYGTKNFIQSIFVPYRQPVSSMTCSYGRWGSSRFANNMEQRSSLTWTGRYSTGSELKGKKSVRVTLSECKHRLFIGNLPKSLTLTQVHSGFLKPVLPKVLPCASLAFAAQPLAVDVILKHVHSAGSQTCDAHWAWYSCCGWR